MLFLRAWYILGVIGLGTGFYGFVETRLAMAAASEPEAISVHDLEQGKRPSQPYVRIDEHFALYEYTSYETKRGRLKDAIYPILPKQHPWLVGWEQLRNRYPNPKDIPAAEKPPLGPIKVLALTKRFDAVDEIPKDGTIEKGTFGILFGYDELDSDERELVQLIEDRNFTDTVVIQVGRKPKSLAVGAGILAAGVVMSVLAGLRFLQQRRKAAPAEQD